MSADNMNQNPPPDTQNVGVTKSELDAKLGEVMAQLQAINSTNQELYAAVASAAKPQPQQRLLQDEDLYSAEKLESKITQSANQIANQVIERERALNSTIYNMAQEYPEIQSDAGIQKAVKEAAAALPAGYRDTAQGIETAILKAVAKAGLMPKSKRQSDGLDPDFSPGNGRGAGDRRPAQNGKLSEAILETASLMGVNINDPETVKRMEGYSKRENWLKYE